MESDSRASRSGAAGTPATVSVVLATYNGDQHVQEQLDSVLAQTCAPLELIVSDDGSTDRTMDIVRAFRETAPFPVVLIEEGERLGYAGNFMRGVAAAHGSLVAFCDQDDVWEPEKLAKAVEAFTDPGVGLFVHTAGLIDERGRPLGRFDQGIPRSGRRVPPLRSSPWGVYYGFSMVVRSSLLHAIPWERRGAHTFEADTRLSHDLWCYFLSTSLAWTVCSPEPLARYRQHGSNATPPVRWSFRRATALMGLAAGGAVSRSEIARSRAALLGEVDGGEYAGAAKAASTYWERLARTEERRDRVYRGEHLAARARRWSALVISGAYRGSAAGGLPGLLGLKDLLAGVIRIRRRTSPNPT